MSRYVLLVLPSLLFVKPAFGAFEVETSSMFWADAVRRGDGGFLPRRRWVQRLSLGGYGQGRWGLAVDLQLLSDLDLDEGDRRPAGLRARRLQVRRAVARGALWDGRLRLDLGRQLRWSVGDLQAFDGGTARLRLMPGLSLNLLAGLVVRREVSFWGGSDLEPDGGVEVPGQTHLLGVGLHGHRETVDVRFDWLQSATMESLQRHGVEGALRWRPRRFLAADARGVWDLGLATMRRADAGVRVASGSPLGGELRYRRRRPTFELSSIFSYFPLWASEEWEGRVHWRTKTWGAWTSLLQSSSEEGGGHRDGAGVGWRWRAHSWHTGLVGRLRRGREGALASASWVATVPWGAAQIDGGLRGLRWMPDGATAGARYDATLAWSRPCLTFARCQWSAQLYGAEDGPITARLLGWLDLRFLR